MLEVVTVWAPRPAHPRWRADYLQLLELQRQSCERFLHRHVIVTDEGAHFSGGYDTLFYTDLPDSLMQALVAGQLAYVRQWSGEHPVVLLDVDCIVTRPLGKAFDGSFDIGVTRRDHPTQPIQNGAIYLAPGSKKAAIAMFEATLKRTGEAWGSDQEALAAALAPVPPAGRVKNRCGARVAFLKCERHNFSDKHRPPAPRTPEDRFVVHFKGDTKVWAAGFAEACA